MLEGSFLAELDYTPARLRAVSTDQPCRSLALLHVKQTQREREAAHFYMPGLLNRTNSTLSIYVVIMFELMNTDWSMCIISILLQVMTKTWQSVDSQPKQRCFQHLWEM